MKDTSQETYSQTISKIYWTNMIGEQMEDDNQTLYWHDKCKKDHE